MRLVAWNVLSLRDDAAAVAGVLVSLQPDVVVLTEAPRFWPGSWSSVRRLTVRTGLRAVPSGRPVCGLLALVRPGRQVDRVQRRLLTPEPHAHRRAGLALTVAGLSVLVTHLDVVPAARLRHAHELTDAFPSVDVVAGDLNEGPTGPAWQLLAAGRTAVPTRATHPARTPRRRIDAVLVGPRWRATPVPVDDARLTVASDHLPVVCDLRPTGWAWRVGGVSGHPGARRHPSGQRWS